MNTMSTSRADAAAAAGAPAAQPAARRILVWDAPVRIVHWLLVLCFAGAWLTAESETLRLVHVTLGYTMAGLVVFRLLWGLAGTRHARFASFVRGPGAALRYLRSLVSRHPDHHTGHNPAGALAILALLGGMLVLVASGWANYNDIGGEWTEELHEAIASGLLALVIVHVLAVLASSWLHRENLVGAMLHGRKPVPAADGIGTPRRAVGALVLACVLGFWWWQWQHAPAALADGHPAATQRHHGDDDD
ncbi:cytochrome B [Massilia arenosa]|uniref:Cytochrome B n=1 Tax=Zemynaea arenosa TaxID=2561931 RepID=A0A4Y9SRP3_9BURK|nr:cytochrome b/b6 domain-containing protein [Massilia arenosa]TFW28157.1 cytochrome B [Massilia arenosa]